MKKPYILILVLSLFFALLLTACDDGSYDDEYTADDSSYEDIPLTAEDCYENEIYDPETESCFIDDSAYADEYAPLTAEDCYENEIYDPETESCFMDDSGYADEYAPLTADDCYEGETYDPETESCTFDIYCEDDAECELILSQLYDEEDLADLEFYDMTEADCLPGESYDPEDQSCYIECDTDAECDQLAAEIYAGLDVYFTDSYDGGSEPPSSKTKPDTAPSDIPDDLSGGDPELPSIARYTLDSNLDLELVGLDEDQPDSQINQARHQEIWAFLRQILPPTLLLSDVSEYHIFSDGVDETLAYVSPLTDDANHWLIAIDIADAGTSGKVNKQDFVHTTIHEFAHILTLEDDQVPPDTSLSATEIEAGEESDIALACTTYYTGEGCALSNSYINEFFTKFWVELYYNDFQDVEYAETDEEYEEKLLEFYETYSDQFVSEYAATNPAEDIAESFAAFVLQEKPRGDSIADEKVRFFYNYPALITVRTHIRSELARMK